jgi:hypothetical protein
MNIRDYYPKKNIIFHKLFMASIGYAEGIVRLTSINLQKKILKNPVFKSTIIFPDVLYTNSDN